MFRNAASLWRRLTHRRRTPEQPVGAEGATDERRVWLRHPVDLRTEVAAEGGDGGFAARVGDVSRGGIRLVTEQPVDPGALLTVGLPDEGGRAALTVLACVVHCHELGPRRWALGCSFAQELSDDDLRAFGAAGARPEQADHRAWERYPCDVRAACQTVSAPEESPWEARVLNVSPAGMALLVPREVDNGVLLSVALHGPRGGEPLTILACVVHVRQQSDGARLLGCNFIRELAEADLKRLL
jgi:hypothetical protein